MLDLIEKKEAPEVKRAKHDVMFEIKSISDDGEFEGHASVFGNVDSYGDVVEAGAFKKTIKDRISKFGKADFPILWNHNPNEPLGVTTSMKEDAEGLAVTGQLNLDVQRAREIRSLMKQGAIKGLSIGYSTIKEKIVDDIRKLKELKLWEWSPVTFPANEAAAVSAVKADQELATEEEKREAALSAWKAALAKVEPGIFSSLTDSMKSVQKTLNGE